MAIEQQGQKARGTKKNNIETRQIHEQSSYKETDGCGIKTTDELSLIAALFIPNNSHTLEKLDEKIMIVTTIWFTNWIVKISSNNNFIVARRREHAFLKGETRLIAFASQYIWPNVRNSICSYRLYDWILM